MRIIDKFAENIVYFPKNQQSLIEKHIILLKSELTNEEYKLDNLTDLDDLYDYYVFNCNFSNIPDGEYKYIIDDNDACGLLILGKVESKINEVIYTEDQKYIVYDNE